MNFGNAAAVVHRSVALTAEYCEVYTVMVPGYRDRMSIYIYTHLSSSGPPVGVIERGAGCPLSPL